MASIVDVATLLMPQGTYSTNQSFPGLAISPRQLPTAAVTIHLLTPPVSSCTFVLEVASTQNGVYSPVAVVTWPAGQVGSKQLAIGANSSRAWLANNTCQWARLSLTTTGALTGSAWLSKPSDGSFGLASRSYSLDGIGAL
jgi:hypothetical protein